nr:MAG TPA: tail protein [Caudoviricetes sp.]
MLQITFIQSDAFDINQIPEQWREYVSVMRMPLTPPRYYVRIGVQPDDSSYRYRALMQSRQLVLKFSLPFFFEFPVGSSCVYEGQTFKVKRPEDIKKHGTRNIEYSMTLSSDDSDLGSYKFRNSVDGRLKWSMCAKPHEFIDEIVKCMNARENTTKWHRGTCIDAPEKTIEFNHTYCDAALTDVANTFETEYEITPDCGINLGKVEYNKTEPMALSYGRGNGFVPGVGRTSEIGGEPVKRLYVQGGERNINRETYGDSLGLTDKPGELLLPLSQTIEYEGRTYASDAHGYYIERIDVVSKATKDDSLDCSEIYPSRIGKCSQWITVDEKKNLYDFVDNTIPANLDFNSFLIPGETMTIIFQTGMLAGKEFEAKYYHDSVNGKAARRWEIAPQEIDGITMPNETFKAKFGDDGDTYAVFGIMLPPQYICDNTNKTGASWDMMREAARKLYDCEEQKFTFTGELQSMWAKRNWESVGGKLVVGGYVKFTDNQFAKNGIDIRIVGIKDYITNPYAPTIELSNSIASPGSVADALQQIDNTEVVIEDTKKSIMQFTKRRFRDALETIGMLEDAQLDNFNSAVSPVAIQTMAMLVGDESLQFLMGKTIATIGSDDWSISYADNALTAPTGYLKHMTIGVNTITADRENIPHFIWKMPAMNLAPKTDAKYYVYAVVKRDGFAFNDTENAYINVNPGTWLMSEQSHRIDENSGTYHLLVGVLNSEYMGERSFATLFGFTEILPGRLTTDIIVSNDGKTYMNLRTGEICGNIKFLSDDPDNPYITIIEGGKIKSELLDVSQIIARSVIVGEPGKQRVEITPSNEGNGSVKIYDENDNEVSVFEGQSYNSINDLYDQNTGGDCSILARTKQIYGYANGVTFGRGEAQYIVPATGIGMPTNGTPISDTLTISDKWYTSAPTEVTLKQGHLHAYAYATSVSYKTSGNGNSSGSGLNPIRPTTPTPIEPVQLSNAYATVIVRIETYSDEALTQRVSTVNIASASASASCANTTAWSDYDSGFGGSGTATYPAQSQDSGIVNIANKKVKIPAGWHRIVIYIFCHASVYGSRAEIEWGNTGGSRNDITASYKNDSYVSRFFANGFCLGTRSDNYIMAMRTNDGMRFIMENNDLGFDFSKSGIRTRAKGKNWMPLPLLIYKASYYFLSTNNTYPVNTSHGYKTFNGSLLSATRTGQGLVTLSFPDSWKTDLGSIGVENLLVIVNSHHKTIDCRVESISTSAIKIAMSDDASLNDGDFGIIVYYLPS